MLRVLPHGLATNQVVKRRVNTSDWINLPGVTPHEGVTSLAEEQACLGK